MNEIKVMNNDEIRDLCIKKDLKIYELEKQLQQKENIIKEVREYIKDACYLDEINYPNSLGHKQTMKILEILDSENKGE